MENLLESFRKDGAYISITVMPQSNNSVFVNWWDEENSDYIIMNYGNDLMALLLEARKRVDEFLAGDKSNWEFREVKYVRPEQGK